MLARYILKPPLPLFYLALEVYTICATVSIFLSLQIASLIAQEVEAVTPRCGVVPWPPAGGQIFSSTFHLPFYIRTSAADSCSSIVQSAGCPCLSTCQYPSPSAQTCVSACSRSRCSRAPTHCMDAHSTVLFAFLPCTVTKIPNPHCPKIRSRYLS